MKWQFSNDAPIYAQLIEQIKVGIVSGAFPPGERLPSVRDLATEAGVNPKTMIETAKRGLAERHVKTFLAAMLRLGFQREEIMTLLRQETGEEGESHGGSGV